MFVFVFVFFVVLSAFIHVCLFDCVGGVRGEARLVDVSVCFPSIGDFNNDQINDVVLVTPAGSVFCFVLFCRCCFDCLLCCVSFIRL